MLRLFLSLLLLNVYAKDVHKKHMYRLSMKKPFFYLDNVTMPFYEYYGNVQHSDVAVRLTSSMPNLKGAVWSKNKNTAKFWSAEFGIGVHGQGHIGGHGMAFWYTKDIGVPTSLQVDSTARLNDRIGAGLGDAFGSSESWDGLGLFFDTYDEETHQRNMPYVFVILNDGSKRWSDMKEPIRSQSGGCFRDFRNKGEVKARVTFLNNILTVALNINDGNGFVECTTVKDIILPNNYYFGVSAHTDRLPDDHDLHFIDVYELDPDFKLEMKQAPKLSDKDKQNFEKVHEQVEKLRHQQEDEAFRHESHFREDKRHVGGLDEEMLEKIHESQFKILDNVHMIAEKIDNIKISGGADRSQVVSGGDPSLEIAKLRTDFEFFKNEWKESYDLIKDIASFVSHFGTRESDADQQHLQDQLAKLHHTVLSSTQNIVDSAGTNSYLTPVLVFLFGQAVLMAVYFAWKARKQEESKKFI